MGSAEDGAAFVDSLEDLQTMGRGGLHHYNNQDHAMITAGLAVDNLMSGRRADLSAINTTGWLYAFLRNGAVFFYKAAVHRRAELQILRKFLEHF